MAGPDLDAYSQALGLKKPPAPKPAETQTPPVAGAPASAPPPPAPAAPASPQQTWFDWFRRTPQMADDAVRSLDRAMTMGASDWLIGGAEGLASGGSPAASIAQERALTDAARQRLGLPGRIATDVAGYAMGPANLGGPLVMGPLSGAVQGYFTGSGGPGGGGGVRDVATGAAAGAAGGGAAKTLGAVAAPIERWARGRFTPDPSSVVYPYVPGAIGTPATLGGVPGVYAGGKLGPATAEDIAGLARSMEQAAQGEEGGTTSPTMQALVQQINRIAERGTPVGGTPGSGLSAIRDAYWAAGGPPAAEGEAALNPVQRRLGEMVGAGLGGFAGHLSGVPMAREAGVYLGGVYGPKALSAFLGPSASSAAASAYPAFAQQTAPATSQALLNLLVGASPDVRQQFWPAPVQ